MAISFNMVGTLKLPTDTETFKAFEEKKYSSGWNAKTLNFIVNADGNQFFLKTSGGYMDDGSSMVYILGDKKDENGDRKKYQIPFEERLTYQDYLEEGDKIPAWAKYTLDIGYRKRQKLYDLKNSKSVSLEDLAAVGAKTKEDLEGLIKATYDKRLEFISQYDYAESIHKMLSSEKMEDKKFLIRGTVEVYPYQTDEGGVKWGRNLIPSLIQIVKDDTAEYAHLSAPLYFTEYSMEDDEESHFTVNGFVDFYDSNRKAKAFAPMKIEVPLMNKEQEHADIKNKVRHKYFTTKDGVKCTQVLCQMLNGAQKREVTEADLTEEQQELLLIGDITLEDIAREMGGVYGDKVSKEVFLKLGNSNYAQETSYTEENMEFTYTARSNKKSVNTVEDDDLFGDEDDDLFGDVD